MNRYNQFEKLSCFVLFSSAGILARFACDWASGQKLGFTIAILLLLGTVTIVSQFLSFLFNTIFERSISIRRLCLGRMFIEGTWI